MSRLQELTQSRNSAKGRIKGLRNNLRGMLTDNTDHLTEEEEILLNKCENELDYIFKRWDKKWEQIKAEL